MIEHARRGVGDRESYHHLRSQCSCQDADGETWKDPLA